MSTTNEAPHLLPQWCGPDDKGRSRVLWSTGELAASHINGRIYISVHSGRYGVFPRKQYVDEDKAFRAFAHAGHPLPPLPEKAEAPAPYVLADDPFFQEPIETKWGTATWRKEGDGMRLYVDGCVREMRHIAYVSFHPGADYPSVASVYAGRVGDGRLKRLRCDNVTRQIVPTLRALGSLPDEAPPAPEPETPARAPAPTASPDPTPEDRVLALAADLEAMARDWWWDGFETDAAVLRGAVEAVRRHVRRTTGEA